VKRARLGAVGRIRKTNRDLPQRVYIKNGAFWYVDRKNKWHRLAAETDRPGMHRRLAAILESGSPIANVQELWDKYQRDELHVKAKKTQQGRRNDMKQPLKVFGKMIPNDIEDHHIWTFWRKRGQTEQARHEIRALSALLTFGRQCGAVKKPNPCYALKLPGAKARDLYVTDTMFYAVHDVAPWQIQRAMELAWSGGLDEATIRKLERRNITATGLAFERGKTGKLQAIDGEDLLTIAATALREAPQVRRFIICRRGGHAYTANGFQIAWQRSIRRAIELGRLKPDERYHFHDLRAKAASEAASDKEAQNLLGHSDEKVTVFHYRRLPQRGTAVKIFREQA
jgi:hypothetical protein